MLDLNRISISTIPVGERPEAESFEGALQDFIKYRTYQPIINVADDLHYLLCEWSKDEEYRIVIPTGEFDTIHLVRRTDIDKITEPKKLVTNIKKQRFNRWVLIDKKYLLTTDGGQR